VRLPDDTQHLVIVGRNGTGKTRGAVWHLSKRDYKNKPWIIFDWKHDDLIAKLPTQELEWGKLPEGPGLYVVHPFPDDQENVDALLWAIYSMGNVGIYVDEGYMLNKSKAYRAISTQGRSKRIPTITLSQRPKNMDLSVFSEATFIQSYALNDLNDRKRVAEWMPPEDKNGNRYDPKYRLPDYHSWYYDVGKDEIAILAPVPDEAETIASFYPEPDMANNDDELQQTRVRIL
jgi:hypothetical protein